MLVSFVVWKFSGILLIAYAYKVSKKLTISKIQTHSQRRNYKRVDGIDYVVRQHFCLHDLPRFTVSLRRTKYAFNWPTLVPQHEMLLIPWPSRCPDLNLINFFVWSNLKHLGYGTPVFKESDYLLMVANHGKYS